MPERIAHDRTLNALPPTACAALEAPIHAAIMSGVAPAIALAVYHQHTLILDVAWGWHDPQDREHPIRTAHFFDLASVTKLYTTVALLQLLSAQNRSLDTALSDIVPEFVAQAPRAIGRGQDPFSRVMLDPLSDYVGQAIDPTTVTLAQLLTHTSGLPAWRDVYTVAQAPPPPYESDPVPSSERWQAALAKLCEYPFVTPPASRIEYSDIGLMLLGEAVARLGGKRLDAVIHEYVSSDVFYRPLEQGIALQAIVPTEYDAVWRNRRIQGEVHDENACGVGGIAGHAGLFASARTVAQLGYDWLHQRYAIRPDLYQAATQVQAQDGQNIRGYGWVLRSAQGSSSGTHFSSNSYGHTGFTGTSLWVDPERRLSVALLTNRVYEGRTRGGIHELRRAVHDALVQAVDSL